LTPCGSALRVYKRDVLNRRPSMLASSTPKKGGLDLFEGGDASAFETTLMSNISSWADNATVADLDLGAAFCPKEPLFSFPSPLDVIAEETEEKEKDVEEDVVEERNNHLGGCCLAILVGFSVLVGILGIYAVSVHATWRQTTWNAVASIASALFADPDVDLEDAMAGAPGASPITAAAATGHVLWLAATVVLFAGLTCRCNPRRRLVLACPWLLMTLFTHLTTASAFFDLLVGPDPGTPQLVLCGATVVFGASAIFLMWREVNIWRQM